MAIRANTPIISASLTGGASSGGIPATSRVGVVAGVICDAPGAVGTDVPLNPLIAKWENVSVVAS